MTTPPDPIAESTDQLALALTKEQVDCLAHALGWPDTYGYKASRGPVRWKNPYRNGFCTSRDDAVFTSMPPGVARSGPARDILGGSCIWSVTELGKAAVELRIRATKKAQKAAARTTTKAATQAADPTPK